MFILQIDPNGEMMQDAGNVANALRQVADRIELAEARGGGIKDPNGNTVGAFAFGGRDMLAQTKAIERVLKVRAGLEYGDTSTEDLLDAIAGLEA